VKRTPVLLAAFALLATGASHGAMAVTKKPAPKPVITTMFLHGTSNYGNQDMISGDPMTLDRKAPTGTTTKEAAVLGGNIAGALDVPKECPGGPYIPAFTGPVAGLLTGVVTVKFYARGTGGNVTVELLADPADCTSAPDIAAKVLAPVPASPTASLVTVKLPLPAKGVKVLGALSVQFLSDQTTTTPGALGISGVSYDSSTAPSAVTFSCLPKTGKKTC
jgi:hypothetical protein